MNMQFMTWDGINSVKKNINSYLPDFSLPTNDWLEEKLGFCPFKSTKYPMPDIKLVMSEEKPASTDAQNVRIIYDAFRFLSDSQASDERIWAGLSVGYFWNYVQYRWKICSAESIAQHYFFGYGPRRSLTRNAIARLWWIGRLTYDQSRSNPYELADFVCESSDNIMHILERNTSNNPMIVKAFIEAILKTRAEGFVVNTDNIGDLAKYLNLLGGVYILDCLPSKTIYEKILQKAHEICTPNKCTQTV